MPCNATIEWRESQLRLAREWCLQELSRLGTQPFVEPEEEVQPANVGRAPWPASARGRRDPAPLAGAGVARFP